MFQIETLENWEVTSFQVGKTLTEQPPNLEDKSLINYYGELTVSFNSYPDVDLNTNTLYYKLPDPYLRNQINSYGGDLNYQATYSGYNMEGGVQSPDVIMVGDGISLLYHSGLTPRPNEAIDITAPIDPYYWVLPSGAPIDRPKLMVVLTDVKGIYIKASYGLDYDGASRYRNQLKADDRQLML